MSTVSIETTGGIDRILAAVGLDGLSQNPSSDSLERVLTALVSTVAGTSPVRRRLIVTEVTKKLTELKVDDAKNLVDTVIGSNGASVIFEHVDPWPEPVEAAEVLDRVREVLSRFVVFSPSEAAAAALWILLTWLIDSVEVMPLLVISAPEKRCGKTTLLDLVSRMVRRPPRRVQHHSGCPVSHDRSVQTHDLDRRGRHLSEEQRGNAWPLECRTHQDVSLRNQDGVGRQGP